MSSERYSSGQKKKEVPVCVTYYGHTILSPIVVQLYGRTVLGNVGGKRSTVEIFFLYLLLVCSKRNTILCACVRACVTGSEKTSNFSFFKNESACRVAQELQFAVFYLSLKPMASASFIP